jgi:hypothetical protein
VRALLEAQAAAAKTIADSLPRKLPRKREEEANSPPKKRPFGRIKRLK